MELPTVRTEKRNAAASSVAAAVVLTGMKLVVGLSTNSLGILSEAAHSGLDLLAAVITLMAVSIADKPADSEHRYGHGKVESLSALIETLLLFVTCGWIILEAVERLLRHGVHVEATVWGYGVIIVSILIDISRSRVLARVAKKHQSQALEADALHFSTDIWSSLTVLLGLVLVSAGYPWVDSVVALVVAFLVLFVSYRLGRRTLDALMDRAAPELTMQTEQAIRRVDGVEELRSLRLRPSGSKLFVDTTVAIRRTLPFERAHAIMDAVEHAVGALHHNADVVVHGEPVENRDETIIDKIRLIVLNNGLRPPHNLEVHLIDGKYFVDFDVEVQKGKSFADAHDDASMIEAQIQRELPLVGKVTIHLEEYEQREMVLNDVSGSEQSLANEIQAAVVADGRVLACTDCTLLREGLRYNVALTCNVERTKTLEEVHRIISELEATLYQKFKQVRRITIHAEPG